jgi:hypothetical protein
MAARTNAIDTFFMIFLHFLADFWTKHCLAKCSDQVLFDGTQAPRGPHRTARCETELYETELYETELYETGPRDGP